MMNDVAVSQYITSQFEGVDVVEANGDTFFFFDPTHMMPFATLVRSDVNDDASDLNREGVYRLNIGVSKETFESMFGEKLEGYDFTKLDVPMPHPVYGKMNWVCVLSPSESTFSLVKVLLKEAYERAVRRQRKPDQD